MKTCSRCGELKPLSEFWPKRKGDTDLYSYCKTCGSEIHKQSRQRHLIEWRRRGRELHRIAPPVRHVPVRTAALKESERCRYHRCKPIFAVKAKVREATTRVTNWVNGNSDITRYKKPMLFRPRYCPCCGRKADVMSIQAHHYLGYDPQNWNDIFWACRRCHYDIHILMRDAVAEGKPASEGFKRFLLEHQYGNTKKSRKIISPTGYSVTSDPRGFEELNKENTNES